MVTMGFGFIIGMALFFLIGGLIGAAINGVVIGIPLLGLETPFLIDMFFEDIGLDFSIVDTMTQLISGFFGG